MSESKETEATSVASIALSSFKPELMKLKVLEGDPEVNVMVSKDRNGIVEITPLERYVDGHLPAPRRRNGVAHFTEITSLIDHANRFSTEDSVVFLDDTKKNPVVQVVLNYHPANTDEVKDAAAFRDHSGVCPLTFSEEWRAWHILDGEEMDTGTFAEIIDDRIIDVLPQEETAKVLKAGGKLNEINTLLHNMISLQGGKLGGPQKLQELSRGISISTADETTHKVNIISGEVKLVLASTHTATTSAAGEKIDVPPMFLICIPVFKGDSLYKIPVRLRYKTTANGIKWSFHLLRSDKFFDDAVRQAGEKVAKGTKLPLFLGSSE